MYKLNTLALQMNFPEKCGTGRQLLRSWHRQFCSPRINVTGVSSWANGRQYSCSLACSTNSYIHDKTTAQDECPLAPSQALDDLPSLGLDVIGVQAQAL